MSSELDFETELNNEVTKRLETMNSEDYEFPERMRRGDFIAAGIIAVVALVVLEFATLTAGAM